MQRSRTLRLSRAIPLPQRWNLLTRCFKTASFLPVNSIELLRQDTTVSSKPRYVLSLFRYYFYARFLSLVELVRAFSRAIVNQGRVATPRLSADESREEDRFAGEAAVGSRPDLVSQLLEGRSAAVPLQFRRQGTLRQR